jgi:hypothetical protein
MLPCQFVIYPKNIWGTFLVRHYNNIAKRKFTNFKYDTSFVGKHSNTNNIRLEVLSEIKKHPEINFFGGLQDSNNGKSIEGKIKHPKLNRKEYVDLIKETKINLALDGYGEFTFRHLEILFLGGFLLSSSSVDELDLPMNITEGEHYVSYGNLEDLVNKIKYYLDNEEERSKISKSGRDFILNHYSVIRHGENIKGNIISLC